MGTGTERERESGWVDERRSAGRGRARGRGWRPVDEHRMGTGTGAGTEARTVVEMGTGKRITGTGTRMESGKAEERRKSARNRKVVVDAVRKTREDSGGKKTKCRKERVGSVAANPDNLESNKEAGGGSKRYSGLK